MNKPILCIDFDGVIHSYTSGWQGAEVVSDPPVPGALAWLANATSWWEVHIYSSRSKQTGGIKAMKDWIELHGEQVATGIGSALIDRLHFSHEKPAAFLTIDDRAICFEGDWNALDPLALKDFQPWNKKPAPQRDDQFPSNYAITGVPKHTKCPQCGKTVVS